MRALKILFALVVAFVALTAVAVAVLVFVPAGPRAETFVQIRPGSGTRAIAAELKRDGIVRSRYAFILVSFLRGGTLKAGEYRFDHPAPVNEVYDRMARGDVYTVQVTIPEGYNRFDIANVLEQAHLAARDAFLDATRSDVPLVADLDPQATSLEGYLFPDTYRFSPMQSAHEIAAAMVHRFRAEARTLGLSTNVRPTVILASLVERETPVAQERPMVAGVFENRLQHGIPLATDPSVVYAALLDNRWRGAIHRSDLAYDSHYNTYRYAGLPPGPICNPGAASLEAAMHPAHTDYLYFVSDNQGHSRFARTLDEHNRNVAAYRAAVRGAR